MDNDLRVERLSVNLAGDVADALRNMADHNHVSITETVRRCISMQAFIELAWARGATLLMRESDGTVREVITNSKH